ncbi:ABC transporter permease [Microvirga pakistanensis]|uniref:ABC transporter permease n=1 Tax=Microvirga pakistanensis TaxID=1682650 RepID=UPI00106961F4|nr:ABC transporter permease subunit [Microvirga pakistanensis]
MQDVLSLLSFSDGGWGAALAAGTLVTLTLALATLPVGIFLGLVVALMARSRSPRARAAATVFTTVFRGLPELLTLLIVYYGGQILIQRLMASMGYEGQLQINAFLAGVVAFGLVLAAFSSEVWVGALNTIARGQYEAGSALGLSRWLTFRLVVFPQLMRAALPGLSNNWLTLLKDTSLISTISLVDLMRQTNLAVGATKQPIVFYLAACVIYLLLSAGSGLAFTVLERRANRGHARG